jgi:hypothetical protein
MADFYVDHNLIAIARSLRELGHSAITTQEISLAAGKDPVHLIGAAMKDRIIVTTNAGDFRMLHEAWLLWTAIWTISPQHAGILLVPQAGSFDRRARQIDALLAGRTTLPNELWEWRNDSAGWTAYDPRERLQAAYRRAQGY